MTRLLKYWDHIRTSFWFLPTLMALAAAGLAFGMVSLDHSVSQEWLDGLKWVYTGGPAGASAVLQTIAGSMITIAGVVFSLTLVALTLASSQFGPRLLRNFMGDTTNQVVLGTFVATFLYCLLVIRTIRRAEETPFVPQLAVTLGVVFALASLWVLIYFIHHVAVSIQADAIIGRVSTDLHEGIDRLFPEHIGEASDEVGPGEAPAEPPAFAREALSIPSAADGYLQLIDASSLMGLAREHNLVLRVERRPGQYVIRGSPLVRVWPEDRVTPRVAERVNAAFVLGGQRTPKQDLEFAVHQLVEIAARALSPGINDPFTAVSCVDRLGSGLTRLARRRAPSPYRVDDDGLLRVIAPSVTFPQILDAAWTQIRQYARESAAVTNRLMETMVPVAAATHREEDRAALRRQADIILRGARAGLPEQEDVRAVEERYAVLLAALDH